MSSAMERKGRLETQCTDMLGVLLLNLGTVYSLQSSVQCTVYSLVYSVQCTMYSL